jgi:SdrD B-like domain
MKKIILWVFWLITFFWFANAQVICSDYVNGYYECALANNLDVSVCEPCKTGYSPAAKNYSASCSVEEYKTIYSSISTIYSYTSNTNYYHDTTLTRCKFPFAWSVTECNDRCDAKVTGVSNSSCKAICVYNPSYTVENYCSECSSQSAFMVDCAEKWYTTASCTASYPIRCEGSIARLRGIVYQDTDNNDSYLASTDGELVGISVELLNSADTVIDVTTTDGLGVYQFVGMAAGTYSVRYTNTVATLQSDSVQAWTKGWTANGLTRLNAITIAAGEVSENNNFGLITKQGWWGQSSSIPETWNPPTLPVTGPTWNTGSTTTGTNTTGTVVVPEVETPNSTTQTNDSTNKRLEQLKNRVEQNANNEQNNIVAITLPTVLPATWSLTTQWIVLYIIALFSVIFWAWFYISRK